jgi:hypothetical protein
MIRMAYHTGWDEYRTRGLCLWWYWYQRSDTPLTEEMADGR